MPSDVANLADGIDAELRSAGTPERAEKSRWYLKSDLDHYGVSVPATRAIAVALARSHPDLTHDELVRLVDRLWSEPASAPVHDRRMAAVELLDRYCDRLDAADAPLLERLLRESRTWALVDGLSANVVGPVVERDERFGEVLDRWAVDEDFWLRRSSMLALLVPLRKGVGDFDRFGRYADSMLEEREFFIRKAIGWVLRDTSKLRPEMVVEWVLPRAARVSGVTMREVVKHLDADQRSALLDARSGRK